MNCSSSSTETKKKLFKFFCCDVISSLLKISRGGAGGPLIVNIL